MIRVWLRYEVDKKDTDLCFSCVGGNGRLSFKRLGILLGIVSIE